MFTFPTLPKLLLLVAVIGVFWWWSRRNQIRARERSELDRNQRPSAAKGKPPQQVEDMAQCKVCNAYVPAKGASRCGRPDCPL